MGRTGAPACPSSLSAALARAISVAAHPFVLIPLTVAVATRSLFWTAVIAASTSVPLLAIILRNVHRGTWSDVDVSRHEQRASLYYAGIPLLIGAAALLSWLGADPKLMRGLAAGAAMFTAGLLGNRFLKISMHMMFAAFSSVTIAWLYPATTPAVATVIVALGWSRRRLDRHTWPEILTGTTIGAIAGAAAQL